MLCIKKLETLTGIGLMPTFTPKKLGHLLTAHAPLSRLPSLIFRDDPFRPNTGQLRAWRPWAPFGKRYTLIDPNARLSEPLPRWFWSRQTRRRTRDIAAAQHGQVVQNFKKNQAPALIQCALAAI